MKQRNSYVLGILLMLVGLVFLGKNTGMIDSTLFHLILSWQMLLIAIGIVKLIEGHFIGGTVVAGIGLYFMAPMIGWIENDLIRTYWPVVFILLGVGVLFGKKKPKLVAPGANRFSSEGGSTSDGFVYSDNTFSSTKQIVLDPVFKGAQIRNIMGGSILDLRRTSLEAKETYIDAEVILGGVEIYLPEAWNVQMQVQATLGGCEEKRYNPGAIDTGHLLVVRGSVILGGITIKN